jgi:DNA-directed RNA polymerase subunit RPC12/RpoP
MAQWYNIQDVESKSYKCGFCGHGVASAKGYPDRSTNYKRIRICPHCENPTYFGNGIQIPEVAPGNEIAHLPESVNQLYKEARNCVSIQAYTSSGLSCRKLLMSIAVSQGADEGKSFFQYVEFLANSGYVPPNGRGWVDHIRKRGNEATHEIVVMNKEIAEELISFIEMLLKFIYEFPAKVPNGENI